MLTTESSTQTPLHPSNILPLQTWNKEISTFTHGIGRLALAFTHRTFRLPLPVLRQEIQNLTAALPNSKPTEASYRELTALVKIFPRSLPASLSPIITAHLNGISSLTAYKLEESSPIPDFILTLITRQPSSLQAKKSSTELPATEPPSCTLFRCISTWMNHYSQEENSTSRQKLNALQALLLKQYPVDFDSLLPAFRDNIIRSQTALFQSLVQSPQGRAFTQAEFITIFEMVVTRSCEEDTLKDLIAILRKTYPQYFEDQDTMREAFSKALRGLETTESGGFLGFKTRDVILNS